MEVSERQCLREEIDDAWKEAGLEDSQDDTQADKCSPVVNEAEADHDGTPEEGQRGKKHTGPKVAHEDGGWRLAQGVSDDYCPLMDCLPLDEQGVCLQKTKVMIEYLSGPGAFSLRSTVIPAIDALLRFVRSSRDTQYINPQMGIKARSTR